jgi:putative Holliday junction resolvase
MGRILCIDYGLKRTGLSMTDPLQLIANKLGTVPTKDLINYLSKLIQKEDIELFVIGQPYHLDGSLSDFEEEILKFIDILQKRFPAIPIEREDETYTSKIAYQELIKSNIPKKKRKDKSLVDSIAATLILQSYLERKKHD